MTYYQLGKQALRDLGYMQLDEVREFGPRYETLGDAVRAAQAENKRNVVPGEMVIVSEFGVDEGGMPFLVRDYAPCDWRPIAARLEGAK